jgi:hypothetical protein
VLIAVAPVVPIPVRGRCGSIRHAQHQSSGDYSQ